MTSNSRQAARTALILYGSESGTAQNIAEEIGRLTERLHFINRVAALNNISLSELLGYSVVVICISTTGQGDLPRNAQLFWKKLRNARLQAPCLARLQYTIFGIGDSSYPQFNWASRKIHKRLSDLGAHLVHDRGESDEQHPDGADGLYVPWSLGLRETLLATNPLPEDLTPIPDDIFLTPKWALRPTEPSSQKHSEPAQPSVTRAYLSDPSSDLIPVTDSITATLTSTARLTPESHWQDVRQFNFSAPKVDYGPGDILTIYPKNFPEDVNEVLTVMGWKEQADKPMKFLPTSGETDRKLLPPTPISNLHESDVITPRQLLENYLDITAIPRRSFFASIAHFTDDETQKERLIDFTNPDLIDELYDYTTRPRRSIVEVLQEFDTVKIPIQWVASIFPIIRGRQFSIASGGVLKAGPNGETRFELLIAIVKYRTVIRKIRQGLCTRYLCSLASGTQLNVSLSKAGIKFDLSKPSVMIGPGTGVAPLRAMAYERAMHAQIGKGNSSNQLLFFGGRNKSADYFYEAEWEELSKRHPLRVFPAFSRDQASKFYVQDLIRQKSKEVFDALQDGYVYICGSSGKMPQAVREALIEVFEKEGAFDRPSAEAYLKELERSGRYQQETW